MFNQLKPRPEHIEKLIEVLGDGKLLTPQEIAKRSGMSLTATYGAIEELKQNNKLEVLKQNKTPRTQVRLSKIN